MEIQPIAFFRSPFRSKFGVPKQSGLVADLEGRIVFEPAYRSTDALRGLEGFDFLWLVWGFSANPHAANSLVVRPPLLGGNEKMGVFATRSPFRPNPLGLSSVRIARIEKHPTQGPVIHVLGADLMDGTPIYDIKPYIPYTDCHPEARGGFTDTHAIKRLQVVMPAEVTRCLTKKEVEMLEGILALDPRPHYHQDATKVYGMPFEAYDIRFRVEGEVLRVVEVATRTPEQP
ncbi:MAG: tRNA (N6-threonylcarbamoyladenosine(37)-N6)-methyltransferase TrmO [Prevotellaceae bacterium]|nr:tRNA (N6-threonylcarbamoyladenosine(37)-N6)-methyltransferase TrmO [Prevotellaceae bacterium]